MKFSRSLSDKHFVSNAGKQPSNEENNMKIIATAVLIVLTVALTQAEPRQSKERNHNYIIERQQAGQVTGVPIIRRIRGKREIDVYRDVSMFEKDHFVGFSKR